MMLAAAAMAFTACEVEPTDLYSTAPVAPVMDPHAGILLTDDTMSEDVTFSWSEARFIGEDVVYRFYASYNETEALLAATQSLYYTTSKAQFRTQLVEGVSIPENDNSSVLFYVVADNGYKTYSSEMISVTLYVNGDFVPSVVTVAEEAAGGVVLSEDEAETSVKLIEWTEARFGYNEQAKYRVMASYNGGESVVLSASQTATSYSATHMALNSALLSIGCPKNTACDVEFSVVPFYDEEELEAGSATVNITTYTPSYPERIYLTGDFGGHSWPTSGVPYLNGDANTGYYTGVVSYYNATYGAKLIYEHPLTGETVWVGGESTDDNTYRIGEGDAYGNLIFEDGTYILIADLAAATLTVTPVTSVGLIGSALSTGWDAQTNFTYNATSGIFELKDVELQAGAYKLRFNDNWDLPGGYNLGGDPSDMVYQGSDITVSKDDIGLYDFAIDFSGPENNTVKKTLTGTVEPLPDPAENGYGLVGTCTGWADGADIAFTDNGDGSHTLLNQQLNAGEGFKIRYLNDNTWNPEGNFGLASSGTIEIGVPISVVASSGSGDMSTSVSGVFDLYFYPARGVLYVMNAGETPSSVSYGLVGDCTGWANGSDIPFTDNGDGSYTILGQQLNAGEGFKIRYLNDGSWSAAGNFGLAAEGTIEVGKVASVVGAEYSQNIKLNESGTFDIYFYPAKGLLYVMPEGQKPDAGVLYGLVGDHNGWGSNDELFESYKSGYYVTTGVSLTEGKGFKIRYYNDGSWTNDGNFGNAGSDSVTVGAATRIENNGGNFNVPATGVYDVYFSPEAKIMYLMNTGDVPAI